MPTYLIVSMHAIRLLLLCSLTVSIEMAYNWLTIGYGLHPAIVAVHAVFTVYYFRAVNPQLMTQVHLFIKAINQMRNAIDAYADVRHLEQLRKEHCYANERYHAEMRVLKSKHIKPN